VQPILAVVLILVLGLVLAFSGIALSRASRRRGDGQLLEEDVVGPVFPKTGRKERDPSRPRPFEADVIREPDVATAPEAVAADIELDEDDLAVEPAEAEPIVRARLRDRLGRTRAAFSGLATGLAGRSRIDDDTWDELEESLILADIGVSTTQQILEDLKTQAKADKIVEPSALIDRLKAELTAMLADADRTLRFDEGERNVWLFVGVNGVGKTTTIAKLAQQEVAAGHTVLLAAADTFRAAAADQLAHWAERTGAAIIRGQEGADPGSIVFDAMSAAASRGTDLVLVDTAGRLHTKVNLMEELKKLRRIVDRTPGALKEVLLVLDATTGQNGLTQAKQFAEAVDVTGVVLTKLDGTARGGIVLAIQRELGLPVKVVGVGEGAGDLVPFDPEEFVAALF
jgi:fused signal recognition particle receptor